MKPRAKYIDLYSLIHLQVNIKDSKQQSLYKNSNKKLIIIFVSEPTPCAFHYISITLIINKVTIFLYNYHRHLVYIITLPILRHTNHTMFWKWEWELCLYLRSFHVHPTHRQTKPFGSYSHQRQFEVTVSQHETEFLDLPLSESMQIWVRFWTNNTFWQIETENVTFLSRNKTNMIFSLSKNSLKLDSVRFVFPAFITKKFKTTFSKKYFFSWTYVFPFFYQYQWVFGKKENWGKRNGKSR